MKWFESYISDRTQTVKIDNIHSEKTFLKFGVPQGSVLGPVLFSMYSQPLSNVIGQYGFNYHIYADDIQLYKSFYVNDLDITVNTLNDCINQVSSWMSANKLRLNGDKTEVMMIGSRTKTNTVTSASIGLQNQNLTISKFFRNLGIIMDFNMTMEKYISDKYVI